ncbi:MAG: aldehyde dehydrogenase family protein [Verrucomicrobiales bacterium]|nr:aldehyde dehydrogenase family protein [Verrucomicrobiales bacterium]
MAKALQDWDRYDPAAQLEAQKEFFRSGTPRSVAFRLNLLRRLREEIERRENDLLEALSRDLGKPGVEAYVSEIFFTRLEIKLFEKKLRKWAKPKRVGTPFFYWPARSEIRYEPYGCALIVAPWNYPVQLSLAPLLSAVAAGNTVILKPSEHAPASAAILEEIIGAVFQPEHVAVVTGGVEVAEKLLELPFDVWFYTGSEKIGRLYAKAAAEHLAPAILELGGKCPCVVDTEIDMERTVERIVATKFFNAGQVCLAPDFVLIPDSLHDEFIERAVAEMKSSYGVEAGTDLARIVNASHYDRLCELLPESAIQVGGNDPEDRFFAPTVIPDVEWDDPVMEEEIFGPILPVVRYRDLDEALDILARRPSPLALYAFSKNRETLAGISASVRSGSVCFNDVLKQATNLSLPFGGVGQSGSGRYRGEFGFRAFTYERALTRRWFCKDPFFVKPPYGEELERLRKLLK